MYDNNAFLILVPFTIFTIVEVIKTVYKKATKKRLPTSYKRGAALVLAFGAAYLYAPADLIDTALAVVTAFFGSAGVHSFLPKEEK